MHSLSSADFTHLASPSNVNLSQCQASRVLRCPTLVTAEWGNLLCSSSYRAASDFSSSDAVASSRNMKSGLTRNTLENARRCCSPERVRETSLHLSPVRRRDTPVRILPTLFPALPADNRPDAGNTARCAGSRGGGRVFVAGTLSKTSPARKYYPAKRPDARQRPNQCALSTTGWSSDKKMCSRCNIHFEISKQSLSIWEENTQRVNPYHLLGNVNTLDGLQGPGLCSISSIREKPTRRSITARHLAIVV